MSFLFDFIPVILFFIAFKFYGIYVATVVGVVVTAVQVVLTYLFKRKVDKQQFITLIVFIIFGGMTLYFHNPIFVKWKPTVIFWIFGIVFLGSQFIGSKPLIQRMLEGVLEKQNTGSAIAVPRAVWKKLNLAWTVFFILIGTVNLYVAYTYSTETWVNFKLYGILSLVMLFSLAQAVCISNYISNGKS